MARIVRDAMITDAPVLDAAAPVTDAAEQIGGSPTDSAVVVEGGKPVGVVTEHDLANGDSATAERVGDVTPPAAFVLRAEDPAAQAIQLMRKRDEPRLPVVDGDGALGVVRLDDLEDDLGAETGASD